MTAATSAAQPGTGDSTSTEPRAHLPSARKSGDSGSAPAGRVREPEKLTLAPGTLISTSAPATRDDQTPPVVGSPATAMCGMPACRAPAIAAATACIWTSALVPSCIRDPPEAATQTIGRRFAVATEKARAILAPSATPIEPPRNGNSKPTRTQASPPTVAMPVVTACWAPAAFLARRSCSG